MKSATRAAATAVLAGMAVLVASLVGVLPASASPAGGPPERPDDGSIEVRFTPGTDAGNGVLCLLPFLGMRHTTSITPTTFTLRITVDTRLCSRVDAVAAIYGMPGNGEAWPQHLKTTQTLTIREAGVTEVIFTRGCNPEQYDVIVGATPQEIAPWGPWHGPLLFPFDPNSSLQSWGCGTPPSTTSTTASTTTTTIDDNCENYTPQGLAAVPTTVAPGGTVTVTGTGTPGTMIQVLLRAPDGSDPPESQGRSGLAATAVSDFAAMADPVQVAADGTWQAEVIVPADAVAGDWVIAAYALGCDTEITTEVTVDVDAEVDDGEEVVAPVVTDPPSVAGEELVAPVAEVVSAPAQVAGATAERQLAFTGTSAHVLLLVGLALVTGGGLVLLQSGRRSRA